MDGIKEIKMLEHLTEMHPLLKKHVENWLVTDLSAIKIILDTNYITNENFVAGNCFRMSNYESLRELDLQDTKKMLDIYIVQLSAYYYYTYERQKHNIKVFNNINPKLDKFNLFFKNIYSQMPMYCPSNEDLPSFVKFLRENKDFVDEHLELKVLQILYDDVPVKELDMDKYSKTHCYFYGMDINTLNSKNILKMLSSKELFDCAFKTMNDTTFITLLYDMINNNMLTEQEVYNIFKDYFNLQEHDICNLIFSDKKLILEIIEKYETLLDFSEYLITMTYNICENYIDHRDLLKFSFIHKNKDNPFVKKLLNYLKNKSYYRIDGEYIDDSIQNLKLLEKIIVLDFEDLDVEAIAKVIIAANKYGVKLSKSIHGVESYIRNNFSEILKILNKEKDYGINCRFILNKAIDYRAIYDIDQSKITNNYDLSKYKTMMISTII